MAAHQGPVVQSALLRSDLIRLRKDKGLTQEAVARDLEWSTSKVIRVEGGHSSITKTDLDALLSCYGVAAGRERERLHDLNRGARDTAWWSEFKDDDISPEYLTYVGYEADAASLRQYHGAVVPGLLQTMKYAEVLAAREVGPPLAATVVRLRMKRQDELAGRDRPPREDYVVDEAVIRRHVGVQKDPSIMSDQLRHIGDVVERDDRVTVRVIPFGAGAHVGTFGAFTLLGFDGELSDVLYLERRTTSPLATGDDPRIAECARAFDSLLREALSAEDSLRLIRRAAREMSDSP